MRLGRNEKCALDVVKFMSARGGLIPDTDVVSGLKTFGLRSDNAANVVRSLIRKQVLGYVDGYVLLR